MERHIPLGEHEIDGAKLIVSTMGGYSVVRDGVYIGWIHASLGDQWNAYVRRPGSSGDLLGRFRQKEAVRAVAGAWDAGVPLPNGCRP